MKADTPEGVAEAFAGHFERLGNARANSDGLDEALFEELEKKWSDASEIPVTHSAILDTCTPISVEETICQVEHMKNHKAAGEDGISAELVKYGGYHLAVCLTRLFEACRSSASSPKEWKGAVIVPIHKKGNPEDPGNYRGVSLLNVVGKLYFRILLARLQTVLEPTIADEQGGFRKSRGCEDQLAILTATMEIATKKKSPLYLCFVDFCKAYDMVWRAGLWEKLQRAGVSSHMLAILQEYYSATQAKALAAKLTQQLESEIGQGNCSQCTQLESEIGHGDRPQRAGLAARIVSDAASALGVSTSTDTTPQTPAKSGGRSREQSAESPRIADAVAWSKSQGSFSLSGSAARERLATAQKEHAEQMASLQQKHEDEIAKLSTQLAIAHATAPPSVSVDPTSPNSQLPAATWLKSPLSPTGDAGGGALVEERKKSESSVAARSDIVGDVAEYTARCSLYQEEIADLKCQNATLKASLDALRTTAEQHETSLVTTTAKLAVQTAANDDLRKQLQSQKKFSISMMPLPSELKAKNTEISKLKEEINRLKKQSSLSEEGPATSGELQAARKEIASLTESLRLAEEREMELGMQRERQKKELAQDGHRDKSEIEALTKALAEAEQREMEFGAKKEREMKEVQQEMQRHKDFSAARLKDFEIYREETEAEIGRLQNLLDSHGIAV